jgi:hypothetical protein
VKHYPLRVGAVLRLAQKHAPEALVELSVELERLGFATWPGFPVVALSLVAPIFPIPLETPNRPLELAKRWLALSRRERFVHVTSLEVEGDYLAVYGVADTLAELVRTAVQTGEIRLIAGPVAARDELQLADLQTFRAVSVMFRADEEKPVATELAAANRLVEPISAGPEPLPARPASKGKGSGEVTGAPAPDPVLLAALQQYAEQQLKERGGKRVKQETLINHAQRVLGLNYRPSRDLARSLPEHLIYPARRRS